ncbi:unnamed protein product [Paramecium octaurelia]|uniref:Uncharacterized protein n=1 Tax=Paramecium octaurelia TaxID=43137 RepID=A0A8S1UI23_PAROT|nr:unnamed protein product [Paramecium octaurelia]
MNAGFQELYFNCNFQFRLVLQSNFSVNLGCTYLQHEGPIRFQNVSLYSRNAMKNYDCCQFMTIEGIHYFDFNLQM